MARVNLENGALGDRRLDRLARKLGVSRQTAIGHLVFLWEESQELLRAVGTTQEIFDWFGGHELPAAGPDPVMALASVGYIREAGVGEWEVVGNPKQIHSLITFSSARIKGGQATKDKWLKIHEAESLKLAAKPAKTKLGPSPMQGNAVQGSAVQGSARHSIPPPSPSDLAVATEWLDFATNQSPSLTGRPGMTVEAFAEGCRKVRTAANLSDEALGHILAFVKADDFWHKNALSPSGLLTKSKNGLRKIDNILARMKPTPTKADREKEAMIQWAKS